MHAKRIVTALQGELPTGLDAPKARPRRGRSTCPPPLYLATCTLSSSGA